MACRHGLVAAALALAGVLTGLAPDVAGTARVLPRGGVVLAMMPAVPAALAVPGAPGLPGAASAPAMQETTAAQDEYVPLDELPPEDRLPAAPFLVAAYTIALVLLLGYVWTLWRRLEVVRRELEEVRSASAARAQGRTGTS